MTRAYPRQRANRTPLRAGDTIGHWTAVRPMDEQRSYGVYPWLMRCRCGTYAVLRNPYHSRRRAALAHRVSCRACYEAERPKIPDSARVCEWCRRPTIDGTGRRTRGKARECGTCERRALRNGRDATGHPRYVYGPHVGRPRQA